MHKNKLVIAVKSHGKVLRERKDSVQIPFGSEYSLFLKNLDSVRCAVRISIDGQSVTDGQDLVINPRSELEIERFIKNGNMTSGNKFKFIERSRKIEDGPRGIQAEDGLITVEFQYEKRAPKVEEIHRKIIDCYPPYPYYYPDRWYLGPYYGSGRQEEPTWTITSNGANIGSMSNTLGGSSVDASSEVPLSSSTKGLGTRTAFANRVAASCNVAQNSIDSRSLQDEENDVGITVPGSLSSQQFESVGGFQMEDEIQVMVLKISGRKAESGELVQQAVTVQKKQKCVTCGHVNKATAKFCSECGTSLQVV